jgi:hypothetical protein
MVTAITLSIAAMSSAMQDGLRQYDLVETHRIGSYHGPTALTAIDEVIVGRDSLLYIAQARERAVRVFTLDGMPVRQIGRTGSGPGEFEGIDHITWTEPHGIAVHDSRNQCLTVVDTAGNVSATVGIVRPAVVHPFRSAAPRVRQADGSYILVPYAAAGGELPAQIPLYRLDAGMTKAEVIGYTTYGSASYRFSLPIGGRGAGLLPLATGPLWAHHPYGRGVVSLEQEVPRESGASYRLRRVAADGSVIVSRVYRYEAERLERTVAASLVRDEVARWYSRLSTIGAVSMRELEGALRSAISLPAFQPFADRIVAGADNSVWVRVQAAGREPRRWIVIRSNGDPDGYVELPSSYDVKFVDGERVVAAFTDENDVDFVVVFRLGRRQIGACIPGRKAFMHSCPASSLISFAGGRS